MMGLAMPASRSLIALLIGTVVFFALWMIALKPSSSTSSGNKQGLGQFQSAINKAHQAVTTSNANDAASGNENATSSSGGTTAAHTATKTSNSASASKPKTTSATSKSKTSRAAKPSSSPTVHMSVAAEMRSVKTAVSHHKVLALLFYNPAAPDDQALEQELAAVPTHRGQVVKLAIPLNEAASFTAVTQQVPLNLSPTLVLISRADEASEDVGYTAPFVIDQQVQNALTAAS